MAHTGARQADGRGAARNGGRVAQVAAWWDRVVTGQVDSPHPAFGDALKVHLREGRLELSGEFDSREERNEAVRQARARIGKGIHDVDASRLRVVPKLEKAGILDQTLIAAFPDRQAAELAWRFIQDHSAGDRVTYHEVVDEGRDDRLQAVLPDEFADDARRLLRRKQALLVVNVDETSAFKIRRLLEEETRSSWTVATPPRLAGTRK